MKVLGIIAEYNPFHKGHLYHLTESKKITGAGVSVAVMSGNFTQRGEAALLSKWERAKIAVDCGVDLVLELPFVYACNNAEYFAKGAVSILNGISLVDTLSFGSESGDIEALYKAAGAISEETGDFKEALSENLKTGVSYPKARWAALRQTAGKEAAGSLECPNNILAAEYLKQLILTESKIVPVTIKRQGRGYNSVELGGMFASAAGIRHALNSGETDAIKEYVPAECYDYINNINIDINKLLNTLFLLISSRILTETEADLEGIFSAGEGLGNKLKKSVRGSKCLEDLISGVKSKRYTRTRIQRLLIHTLMNLTASGFRSMDEKGVNYTRVLAFNDKGAALLKAIKACGPGIPVITNINKQFRDDSDIAGILKYDILAQDLYNMISGRDMGEGSDFLARPYHKFG